MKQIPFNKPCIIGPEEAYIRDAVNSGKISGNGKYTQLCHSLLEKKYGFAKVLLTTSCTDALEMSAILLNIKEGDEVIAPSYTFVSTVNAFILRGAKVIFADSRVDHPGVDENHIEELVTDKTKAIIPVHYAGIACDMDKILSISRSHGIPVIEDAAQSIDNYYIDSQFKRIPLGSIGDLGTFSFHETKNIISGEGGALVVNDKQLASRAEVIWEKGTNRSAFFRGEVDKYGWVDIGSSFLPSELVAAFLYSQLENISLIQAKRLALWRMYYEKLKVLEEFGVSLPSIPKYSTNNAHIFYLVCNSLDERSKVIEYLKTKGVHSVFHYLSLHKSSYYKHQYSGKELNNADKYSDRLLRLPLYYSLEESDVEYISDCLVDLYRSKIL